MNRHRLSAFAILFVLFGIAAGCGKKDPPGPPEVVVVPKPDPAAEAAARAVEAEKAAKAEAVTRLKAIGKALHEYEAANGQLPAGVVGPKGELGLSWRVQILPYLGKDEAKLYEQFNPKEPWDSETNKKLIAKMPKVFESPGKAAGDGKTHLRSFAGESAFVVLPPQGFVPKGQQPPPPFARFQPGFPAPGSRFAGISDGSSNTLAVAEAPDAVEWTKPDELPFPGFPTPDRPIPAPKLGGILPGGFHALMCDGAVHFFPAALDEKIVSAMISVNGGEVLPEEVTKILFPPKPPNAGLPDTVPDSLPDAAARKTAVANYQKILKGMHEHHDMLGYLPAGIRAQWLPGLSWRVQVLPFIGEEKLYKEFKLDQAWDSDHNKKLVEKMPAVFASPGKAAEKGHTFVRTTIGPGGIIPALQGPGGKLKFERPPDGQPGRPIAGRTFASGIPDGASNTILFVEAGEAVPWTSPAELLLPTGPIDPKTNSPVLEAKLPPLGGVFGDGFHAVMADGRVTFYKTGYPSGSLAKMFCPADGWIVEPLGPADKIAYSIPFPTPPGKPGPKDGGKGGPVPFPKKGGEKLP